MNILILSAGGELTNEDNSGYPAYLTEIKGKPLIEILLQKFDGVDANFSVMLRQSDVNKFNLDSMVKQINNKAKVYSVSFSTAGALCTALIAIEKINNEQPLVILNGDEILDINYNDPIDFFNKSNFDAGAVIFDSIHPRYSYVRIDNGLVVEAAEKNPISRNATAGFYWYKTGTDFVDAAFNSIRKYSHSDIPYFICPVFNEFILAGKTVGTYPIDKKLFKPFKSQQQINKFNSLIEKFL
jgi:NDP-sugar pyrophosphorylase family protein